MAQSHTTTDALEAEVSCRARLGATPVAGAGCQFLVWAPFASRVELMIEGAAPLDMDRLEGGYYSALSPGARPGSRYQYRLDGEKVRPDPASHYQPQGPHGPSQVVDDAAFRWTDQEWRGLGLDDYIFYEAHVGTATAAGTFDALIADLPRLADLGVTALEIMPVAQFPGARNWGYDGTFPFAVQNSYGGPDGLKRLVNAAHRQKLAVVLDVVYNHLGPEGNYLADFGPYFTERYRTPWGAAINFDGEYSDEVVRYFTENALRWFRDFHVDALRLDAVHGIVDLNAQPFLKLLADAVHAATAETGRKLYLVAESDLNDARIVLPPESGGYGHDAQWNDDFHHALHTLLTGERGGYYQDFGTVNDLARSWRDGFVYSGQYSEFRKRRHGNSSAAIAGRQFVVCAQNHDQVGNRMLGERLGSLTDFEGLKLAAGMVLLAPFLPLLFMGEEYGETAPFLYFTSHSDRQLVEAVRRGRREEFAAFEWKGEPPDPQSESTFSASKLDRGLQDREPHHTLLRFYQELIRLRKTLPALRELSRDRGQVVAGADSSWMAMCRGSGPEQVAIVANFDGRNAAVRCESLGGSWEILLDSAASAWRGPGSDLPPSFRGEGAVLNLPHRSFALYRRK